ncbi:hypothetical protein [Novacetimonas hansenii]|uniref:hypothetical protein n=1 Tax=Novacetimonas hansenii TaxID=436 RepID=UPI000789BE74|nr:hypothetical protein [Novacetimonas hansenii]RFP03308.1 hypothetical protein BGC30_11105 [Novacetimonas hansenii]WEQ59345.1 hypothetical protein LV563_01970 [Novacetimonas hansenii]CUW47035.1 hypothetical protein ATCC53582_01139 [Novacetimonas hansenii]
MKPVVHLRRGLALAMLGLVATASPVLAGTFDVTDGCASDEISEVSRLYIDERLVATFQLDPRHPERTVNVETPVGRVNHSYALCGEITIRLPSGKAETHEVSGEGVLHAPNGHHLVALGAKNFTEFYLDDPDDSTVVEHYPGRSSLCAAPTS